MSDIPRDFPHVCGAARTWKKTTETRYDVTCSFCRKDLGYWQFYKSAHIEKKIYPENSKFELSQKQKWK